MPLTSTTPKLVSKVEADNFNITHFSVDAGTGRVTVWYDASLSGVQVLTEASFSVDGTSYGLLKPNGAKTWYENLKALVYKMGQDTGAFPAGTIS